MNEPCSAELMASHIVMCLCQWWYHNRETVFNYSVKLLCATRKNFLIYTTFAVVMKKAGIHFLV